MYRVLVPVDASEERATAQALAVRGLSTAGAEVTATVLHVFPRPEDGAGTAFGSSSERAAVAPSPPVDQLLSVDRAVGLLHETAATVETAARRGDPTEEIVRTARETDADAVVLGGRKRSVLGSLLFGSVTRSVLRELDRPVTVTGGAVDPAVEGERERASGGEPGAPESGARS
ncbi:MAG: universal stress protein UspA related nucleotide-binding protein [uncultured archaeon A07HB70]|nr:MAG: universal stress protein UspA related nucleotide-binding protein [uncultured archaeon A07HB70]